MILKFYSPLTVDILYEDSDNDFYEVAKRETLLSSFLLKFIL